MPSIVDLVRLRPEVLEGNLHGIVSLYSLLEDDADAFERDPSRVLSATYPSLALKRLLQRLATSLSEGDGDRKGNFVISGGYGSGKSHLLLGLYHILTSRRLGNQWLKRNDISFAAPRKSEVILLPMTNLRDAQEVEYLWQPIFRSLGYEGFHHTGSNFPTTKNIEDALGGRQVFVIIDEIERWFMPIRDRHQAEANVTFLQNLTEFAEDASRGLFAFISLLGLEPRICNIVERSDRFVEDLTQAPDRRDVVLHRLVESVDSDGALSVVEAYLEQYKPVDSHVRVGDYNRYRDEMLRCYPFHPETIEVVFDRYSSVARLEEASYQNSRGALYLLAHTLREIHQASAESGEAKIDLVLPGDVSLAVGRIADDLRNLNPSLVQIAADDIEQSEAVPHAVPVLSTVLLHSLGDAGAERRVGAEFRDVLFGCLRPGETEDVRINANQIQATLRQLDDTALHLHVESNPTRWLFREEVSLSAQVNRRARSPEIVAQAPDVIVGTIKEQLGGDDRVAVLGHGEIPDRREVTVVVAVDRMENDEITDSIYRGKSYANALIVVEPRDRGSLTEDPDLRWMAQTILAAEKIKSELLADAAARRQLQDMITRGRDTLLDRIKDRYGVWRVPIFHEGQLTFGRTELALDRDRILRAAESRYDDQRFRQNVMEAVVELRNTPPKIDDIRADFYRQRSFAKPIAGGKPGEGRVDAAITSLVREGQLEIIKGGDEHYVCGKDPGFLQREWTVAVPPEEHKPKFRLRDAILEYVKNHPSGARIGMLHQYCLEQVGKFPSEVIPEGAIDQAVIALAGENRVSLGGETGIPSSPLAADLTVYPVGPGPLPLPRVTLGPLSIAQAKTRIVQELAKTDRLSKVVVSYRHELTGDAAASSYGAITGSAQKMKMGKETRLELSWTLREAPATKREELLKLLETIPHQQGAVVQIEFEREATPPTSASEKGK